MNFNKATASHLVSTVIREFAGNIASGIGKIEVVFCPPYVYLDTISNIINNLFWYKSSSYTCMRTATSINFTLGAQDVSEYFEYGPHTGQINSHMLLDLGCKYAIIGHSECVITREQEFNLSIQRKVCSLLKNRVTPILCIGESIQESNSKTYVCKVINQLHYSIHLLDIKNISDVIIAYEPLWSIGSGNIPTFGEISEITTIIKNHYTGIKLLYGGSVNSSNIEAVSSINSIDGVLIGNASLNAQEFIKIIRIVLHKANLLKL